jgi:hypothetical protein
MWCFARHCSASLARIWASPLSSYYSATELCSCSTPNSASSLLIFLIREGPNISGKSELIYFVVRPNLFVVSPRHVSMPQVRISRHFGNNPL